MMSDVIICSNVRYSAAILETNFILFCSIFILTVTRNRRLQTRRQGYVMGGGGGRANMEIREQGFQPPEARGLGVEINTRQFLHFFDENNAFWKKYSDDS